MLLAAQCLHSLEKSEYKTVLLYNQGFWEHSRLKEFLKQFALNMIIIGSAGNIGIVAGRQACFQYIWDKEPLIEYISELHLDMVFTRQWELPLLEYLDTHDEPVISCGIVDRHGQLLYTGRPAAPLSSDREQWDDYLDNLRRDELVFGFTHPCLHRSSALKAIGGFDTRLLKTGF